MQTMFRLMVSMTALPRAPNNGVAYQDVKEPLCIIAKNAILVFMLNILDYITVSRAVCKVYKKVIFHFSFSLFIILAKEGKISRDHTKISLKEITERWNIKLFSSLHNICRWKLTEKSFDTSIFDLFQFVFTPTFLIPDIRKNVHKFWHVRLFQKNILLHYLLRQKKYQNSN